MKNYIVMCSNEFADFPNCWPVKGFLDFFDAERYMQAMNNTVRQELFYLEEDAIEIEVAKP